MYIKLTVLPLGCHWLNKLSKLALSNLVFSGNTEGVLLTFKQSIDLELVLCGIDFADLVPDAAASLAHLDDVACDVTSAVLVGLGVGECTGPLCQVCGLQVLRRARFVWENKNNSYFKISSDA